MKRTNDVLLTTVGVILLVLGCICFALVIDYGAWLIYTHFAIQFGWPRLSFWWFLGALFLFGLVTGSSRAPKAGA